MKQAILTTVLGLSLAATAGALARVARFSFNWRRPMAPLVCFGRSGGLVSKNFVFWLVKRCYSRDLIPLSVGFT